MNFKFSNAFRLGLIGVFAIALSACKEAGKHEMVKLVTHTSPYSFEQTVLHLRREIEKRPLNLFAEINHADGAAKAALKLAPSTLFIFGNPIGGTPLMNRNPQMGIALPLKIHVYKDGDNVKVTYEDIVQIAERYGLDPKLQPVPKIAKMQTMLVSEAVAPE